MSEAGHVEIIYIDSNGDARKTGLGAAGATWDETLECFAAAKAQQCDTKEAEFLCDLHDKEGDIIETVGLSRRSVEQISGEVAKSDDEYVRFDYDFWDKIRAA